MESLEERVYRLEQELAEQSSKHLQEMQRLSALREGREALLLRDLNEARAEVRRLKADSSPARRGPKTPRQGTTPTTPRQSVSKTTEKSRVSEQWVAIANKTIGEKEQEIRSLVASHKPLWKLVSSLRRCMQDIGRRDLFDKCVATSGMSAPLRKQLSEKLGVELHHIDTSPPKRAVTDSALDAQRMLERALELQKQSDEIFHTAESY